jgi:DNA ligase-1
VSIFSRISDADLVLASRYFSGYVFSLRDQRTFNVGGAALISAIVQASGADETMVRTRLVALGVSVMWRTSSWNSRLGCDCRY